MKVLVGDHYKSLGALIRERRKEKKLTQTQVGDFVGVTKSMVSKWERGEFLEGAAISNISKLSKVLELNPLLFLTDRMDRGEVNLEDYIALFRELLNNEDLGKGMEDDQLIRVLCKVFDPNKIKKATDL